MVFVVVDEQGGGVGEGVAVVVGIPLGFGADESVGGSEVTVGGEGDAEAEAEFVIGDGIESGEFF
ncbi:MAG: hypothetical protein RI897_2358 [Verrucomicrobiota bacterium]